VHRQSMTPLCHINDIDEQASKSLSHNGQQLFAVKKDNQFYLYANRCPHLGIELNWQEDQFLDREDALIMCSTHGALFIIESGQCVAGPCMGDHLQAINYDVIDGMITLKQ